MGAQEGLVKDVLEGQITGEDVLDVLIRQNAEESL